MHCLFLDFFFNFYGFFTNKVYLNKSFLFSDFFLGFSRIWVFFSFFCTLQFFCFSLFMDSLISFILCPANFCFVLIMLSIFLRFFSLLFFLSFFIFYLFSLPLSTSNYSGNYYTNDYDDYDYDLHFI